MFKKVWLNGKVVGEPDFFAIRAGELGVPIGMVSGDQVVAEQVLALCPDAEAVIVKEALGNQSAICMPPLPARDLIHKGAKTAVERAIRGELKPFTDVPAPHGLCATTLLR